MSAEQNISEAPQSQSPLALPVSMAGESGGEGAGQQGPNPGHGLGQSKSSRRRRRKRKGKSGDTNVLAEGGSDVDSGSGEDGDASEAQPQSISATNGSDGQPQPRAGQQQQQPGPGKRWKKKFRDRQRQQRPDNPGNQTAAQPQGSYSPQDSNGNGNGAGFKRKSKQQSPPQQQRRTRGAFVGPMDHSYRAVNGNYAESSPSTIEVHGNFKQRGHHRGHQQSDAQPIDHSMPRAIPIPEGAQTRIYFFVEDLFITAKIQETARKLGVKVGFVKNEKDDVAKLTAGDEQDRPALIVFDLNNVNAKPLTLVPKLKAKLKRSVSIVGFLSHLQGDLRAKAVEAGCDAVMPRAAFSQNLPNLLRRYGIEEEPEEQNFNQ